MLDTLERYALRGARMLSAVGLGGLCLLAAMTLADGIGRVFNMSIDGVRDIGGLVIAVAVASCLPMGLVERSHITVKVFAKRSPALADAVNAFASIVVFAVCVVVAWQLQSYAAKLAHARETSWVLQIPVAPFWWVVAVILWGAVLVQAVLVLRDVARLTARRSDAPVAMHGQEQGAL
jgi:TRAP-type transport system small permease protein